MILGAGLDTFAYRNPFTSPALRVFEVDHPATQAWKRQLLETAEIFIPSSVTYAAINFERQTLSDGLRAAGFESLEPTFFAWLGVSMYLVRVPWRPRSISSHPQLEAAGPSLIMRFRGNAGLDGASGARCAVAPGRPAW